MRVEPYTVGSIVHTIKRGARGMPITKDDTDRVRFMRLLYYANDEHQSDFWEHETTTLGVFGRPDVWLDREPLVAILGWVLMPNHFHLLLKEIREGGISTFMQKVCGSMSVNFNAKYNEQGSLFQGPYRGRTVDTDEYLRYVVPYILLKNVLELYPGGLLRAAQDFDRAWEWALRSYPFSSLAVYALGSPSPIIEKDILGEIFESPRYFYECARDMVLGKTDQEFMAALRKVTMDG